MRIYVSLINKTMLMKKVYLMFFGTMFAMCAMAQQGKGGLVLDSTYTTTGDGTRQEKSINEYNANKQQTATFMYSYKDKNGNQLSVPLLTSKTEPTYDAQSRVTKLNTYSYANDAYTLTAVMEMSGFNSSGLPTVTIMKAVSEEDPSAGLQNMMKTEVTKFGNYGSEDEKTYMWQDGDWMEMSTVHIDYNNDGTVAKETEDMGGYMTTVTTYEYDANQNVTKETASMTMMGTSYGNTVTEYTNEYYADGNLKKVTTIRNESTSVDYYFWGDGKAKGGVISTAIQMVKRQQEQMLRIYDLQGRSVKHATKGLYIVNGRKMMIK